MDKAPCFRCGTLTRGVGIVPVLEGDDLACCPDCVESPELDVALERWMQDRKDRPAPEDTLTPDAQRRWQQEKARDRKILLAILQRMEGEPIVVDGHAWEVTSQGVRDNDPGDGPTGCFSVTCEEERRHVDFEIECCAFGVVVPKDRSEGKVGP